jgi:hypothetical protein
MHCGVFFSVLPFGKLSRFLSSVPEDDLYIRISGGVVLERDINGKKIRFSIDAANLVNVWLFGS